MFYRDTRGLHHVCWTSGITYSSTAHVFVCSKTPHGRFKTSVLSESRQTSHQGQSGAFVDSSDPRLTVKLFDTVHWSFILHLSCWCLDLHTHKTGKQFVLFSSLLAQVFFYSVAQQTVIYSRLCTNTWPLTCRRHLMRSPGVMMAVVNTPDNIPAANSCGYLQETESSRTVTTRAPETKSSTTWGRAVTYVRISSGVFCCSFLPNPNPKKQTANMGVTPMMGAAMPL